jgi:pyruvate dehydrogenase complex dehydrogenase (E1) component
MSERFPNDVDPIETRDWLQAIESVIREEGVERAQYLIDQLLSEARKGGVKVAAGAGASNYVNTIAVEDEPEYPGNLELERRIRSAIRWNAIMTVLRASKKTSSWVATWHPSSPPQRYMMFASTTSSVHATSKMAAIWCTSRATSLRASTHVHSWKVV